MPKTLTNIDIHDAVPRAHLLAGSNCVSISVPLNPDSPFENCVTIYIDPALASRLADEIKVAADRALRIQAIAAEVAV
jgi:hypothetical protein